MMKLIEFMQIQGKKSQFGISQETTQLQTKTDRWIKQHLKKLGPCCQPHQPPNWSLDKHSLSRDQLSIKARLYQLQQKNVSPSLFKRAAPALTKVLKKRLVGNPYKKQILDRMSSAKQTIGSKQSKLFLLSFIIYLRQLDKKLKNNFKENFIRDFQEFALNEEHSQNYQLLLLQVLMCLASREVIPFQVWMVGRNKNIVMQQADTAVESSPLFRVTRRSNRNGGPIINGSFKKYLLRHDFEEKFESKVQTIQSEAEAWAQKTIRNRKND